MRPRLGLTVLVLGLLTVARASADDKARIEAEAQGQAARADALFKAGEFAAAIPFYQAERVSRAATGDRRFEAHALRAIGCCHEQLADDDAAIDAWRGASVLDAKREDHGYEGYDLFLIGRAHLRRGRLEQAQVVLKKAIPLLSTAVDRDHEADAQFVLALAYLKDDRPEDAAPHAERAEALANALDDPKRRASAWLALGHVALARESPGLAAERFLDACAGFEETNSPGDAALADRGLAEAFDWLDHADAATFFARAAVTEHRALGDDAAVADDLRVLMQVRVHAKDFSETVRYARQIVEARHAAGDLVGEVDAQVELAEYQVVTGAVDAAWKTIEETVRLAREGVPASRRVRLLLLAEQLGRDRGHVARADELLDEADRVAKAADNGALRRMVRDARNTAQGRP